MDNMLFALKSVGCGLLRRESHTDRVSKFEAEVHSSPKNIFI